jgi:hypothetical protein
MTGPLLAVGLSYLLAAFPVGAAIAAGRTSPMYARPVREYLCWWSWGAFLVLNAAYLLRVA